MQFIFNLFTSYPYFVPPYDWIGWLGLVVFIFVLVYSVIKTKPGKPVRNSQDWVLFIVLLFLGLAATLFIGLKFPVQNNLNLFGFSVIYRPVAVMVFSAIPVMLCGGFFGPRYAVLIGAASGFLMGYWNTHSLFTIVEYAGLSLLVTLAIRQRYRSSLFRFLRHPLAAGLVIPLVFMPVIMVSYFFGSAGELAVRIDYGLTQSWAFILARWIEYFAAGIIAEIFYLSKIKNWAPDDTIIPLPWEKKLSLKFMFTILPIFGAAFLVLLMGDWVTAGIAARKLTEDRMGNLAYIASESLPYFLETGQNLILNYAGEDLLAEDADQLPEKMSAMVNAVPFFTEMNLFDVHGNIIQQFPENSTYNISSEERAGLELARMGASVQTLTVGMSSNEHSAKIAFIARIEDEQEALQGVLTGYTDLETNPFTQPAIKAIRAIEASEGEGWLLDEESQVVYHSNPEKVMNRYFGSFSGVKKFYEQSIQGEVPEYLYVERASGRPWTIVLSIPTAQVQQIALDIAVPLLFVLVLISLAVLFFIRILIAPVSRNLHALADRATLISNGHLEHSLHIQDQDEVGQLAEAFEQMRLGLISRIEDINSLLWVSQGVAKNLDVDMAIQPILQACMRKAACSARAVLYEAEAWRSPPKRISGYGYGEKSEAFARLDDHILELMLKETRLIIPNCYRSDLFHGVKDLPGALLSFVLQHDNRMNGILWVGFERPQQFSESDLQFYSTLAGQASLAVGNAALFRTTEVGRQRMEAILNASPEPILVFDHNMHLLLLNTASRMVPSLIRDDSSGAALGEVISHKILAEMISQPYREGTVTREIIMPNGRTYMASVAEVNVSGKEMGKICMLRDVSRYKELDTLKSEFVSTVSHDLKSPLMVMKGYTTMLEMVGELNQQQKSYTQKISDGIEQMSQLVEDILDLTRIESTVGLNITRFNLIEAIEKIVSMVETRAAQKNIQLILNESVDSSAYIQTDLSFLQQALLNLLENAIKYTTFSGQIEITTRFEDEAVVFEIKDNGMGISAIDVPYIFDKFYRSGTREASRQKGSGLGLAIVKSIADRLEGKVWVQSQLGKGSTFYFELPYGHTIEVNRDRYPS